METASAIREGRAVRSRRPLSPSGARAAFEFRGEIVTVPAEKGDPRNLTNSVAAHDRSPAWSPDGRTIACFSDASGEYALHLAPQDGKGETREDRAHRRRLLRASDLVAGQPEDRVSRQLVGAVRARRQERRVEEDRAGADLRAGPHDQDALVAGLEVARLHAEYIRGDSVRARLFDRQDKSFPITDGLSEVSDPVFDKSGKYLFFLASTDAGPVKDWFAQSNADMRATQAIYIAVLRNDLPSPIAQGERRREGPAADEAKKAEEKKNPLPGPESYDGSAARAATSQRLAGRWARSRAPK